MAETVTQDRTATSPIHTKALFVLALALVAASSMVYYHLGLFIPRVLEVRASKGLGNGYAFGDDFYPLWLASRVGLREHRDLYDASMTREIQTGLFGRPLDANRSTDPPADYRTFAYPAFTNLLFWPAAWAEFPTLRIVLAVVLPILTACSIWLWMLALEWRVHSAGLAVIVLLTLCNYPVLEALFAEQPGLIVGFLLAAVALSLRRNRLLQAGILLALTTIKPQMMLLAIAYLFLWSLTDWRRRFRFVIGFSTTMFVLLASSLFLWPRWVRQWMNVVFGYHRYATPPLAIELLGPAFGARSGLVMVAVLILIALWLMWQNRRAAAGAIEFWLTLSLLLAITSVTLLPGQAIYDHVILLPGIFLLVQFRRQIFSHDRIARFLLVVGGLTLAWPWLAAFGLIVVRPWLSPERFYSTAIFALPIRTAGSFPFLVLALLAFSAFVAAGKRRPKESPLTEN